MNYLDYINSIPMYQMGGSTPNPWKEFAKDITPGLGTYRAYQRAKEDPNAHTYADLGWTAIGDVATVLGAGALAKGAGALVKGAKAAKAAKAARYAKNASKAFDFAAPHLASGVIGDFPASDRLDKQLRKEKTRQEWQDFINQQNQKYMEWYNNTYSDEE